MPWFVRSSKSKRKNRSRRSPRLVGYRLLVTPSDRRAEPVSVFRPNISAPYTGRQQSISRIPHIRHFHPNSGAQVGTTSAFIRTTQHPQQTGDSPSSSKWPAQCSEQNQVQYRRPLGSLDNFPRVLPSTSLCLESQPQVVFAESQHKSTASSGTGVDRLEFGRGCSRPAELLTTLTAAPASPAAVLPVHRHLPLPPSASNSNSTSSSSDPSTSTSTSAPTASVSAASLSASTSSASPFRRGMTVASYGMVLCGNSDDVHHRYRGKLEKVKFGVPISEAFAHDIPATLLVLLLKVNKEGPYKKDIWRAPGNQQQVRKLAQIMQHGRLVNIANFSVYTAASVIKKFLSKLPGGIFGHENEQSLFNNAVNNSDIEKQRQVFYRVFCSLPVPSQHLLVLLFGTFRTVADSADAMGTTMTPNAIAISVAPSLFHSCIHDGRAARVEDLQRFKLASQIVCSIITSFGDTNLFPRESYEFYARITGRQLRVDENWTFSFTYPSSKPSSEEFTHLAAKCAGAYSMAALHLQTGDEPSTSTAETGALTPTTSGARRGLEALGLGIASTSTEQSTPHRPVHRAGSLKHHPLAHTTDHPKRPAKSPSAIHGSSRPGISSEIADYAMEMKQSIS
ncbi:hypothetical protein WR25_21106, partial [Diploscapter pachys]